MRPLTKLAPILLTTAAFCQSPAFHEQLFPAPTFAVAAIHVLADDDNSFTHIYNLPRNSNFKAVNVSLRDLLEVAYEIPDTQIVGGPAWASSEKFNLEAKSDAKLDDQLVALTIEQDKQEKAQMLRTLLADRFKVVAHAEKHEMPIYALVIAKSGSKLIPTDTNGGMPSGGRGHFTISGRNDTLAVLAFELSWRLGRPVVNQTGLTGQYEINLNWTEDDSPSASGIDSNGASIFTAIQEQLGLKLESTKGSVPILVIDHAEKPSVN